MKNLKALTKRTLAVALLLSFGANAVLAINISSKIMGGMAATLSGIGVSILTAGCIYYSRKDKPNNQVPNLVPSEPKNGEVKNWNDVGKKWLRIHEKCKPNSPEWFETLAEYNRCLTYQDKKYCAEASKNYLKASETYLERSKNIKDKSSYDYQINSAKAAEMKAKSGELRFEYGSCMENGRPHCCMSQYGNCRITGYRLAWEALIGKKPSYDAYAKAEQAEAFARIQYDRAWLDRPDIQKMMAKKSAEKLWEDAAKKWRAVQTDQALKESFSIDSWKAFKAFAEAKAQECLLKCHKTTKENVSKAWMDTYEKDHKCSGNWYRAFEAEAYLRAKLVLRSEA